MIDGIFYAGSEPTTVVINAKKGRATGSITLYVLSSPNEISISPSKASIITNDKITYKVTLKNRNGFYGVMENEELEWNVVSGDGTIKDGVFSPSGVGTYLIEVAIRKC